MEGSGRGLFQDVMSEFAWRDWGKLWESVSQPGFESRTSRIQVRECWSLNQHFFFIFRILLCYSMSRDSAVGIATGYGLDGRGVRVRVSVGARLFSSPQSPNRFWGPPNLLCNRYRGPFPGGKATRVVKLITHVQLVPRSRIRGSIHPLPHTPTLLPVL
jgi:hypothetical protein